MLHQVSESCLSFSAIVQAGDQHGRQIGFRTINFDSSLWPKGKADGVYVCRVGFDGGFWLGVLYYGPRYVKQENKNVLEVHVLDFDQLIYNQLVNISVGAFLREPRFFSPDDNGALMLARQISADVENATQIGSSLWPEIVSH